MVLEATRTAKPTETLQPVYLWASVDFSLRALKIFKKSKIFSIHQAFLKSKLNAINAKYEHLEATITFVYMKT